ncbi:MAG: PPC domain-containing protein [Deltaproteobacteria bacterium]|nr:PPC domain-containing protein [Deltaproteobacteria bacterium]
MLLGLAGAYGCSGDGDRDSGVNPPADSGVTDTGTNQPDTGVETDSGVDAGVTDTGVEDAGNPACVEDSLDNHTAATAATVNIGDDFPNLQICSGVDDFFKITATAGQRIAVGIYFTHATGDLDMEVYAPGDLDNPIAQGVSASDDELVSFIADVAGDYVIRVIGYNGAEAPYQMSVLAGCFVDAECSAPQVCDRFTNTCYDYVEPACGADGAYDPNGSNGQAVALDLSSGAANITGLSSCDGDLDFFTFTTVAGDSITAQVTPATTPDGFVMFLADATGTLLTNFPSPDAASLPYMPAGTWYFIVLGAEEGYSLNVTKTAGACMANADCAGSPFGNFCQTGVCGPLVGNGMIPLGGQCDDDSDCVPEADGCYAESPSPDGFYCTIACQTDAECTTAGLDYCAEDRGVCEKFCNGDSDLCFDGGYCGETTNECRSVNCTFGVGCDAAALTCEWVRGTSTGECGAHTQATCGQGGVGEPNDSASLATPITLTGGTATLAGSICDGDADVYSITITEVSTLDIAVTWAGSADVDFVVAPTTDTRVVGAGFGINAQDETAPAAFLSPGTYYIVVGPWTVDDVPDMAYSLQVTATAAMCTAATCLDTNPLRQECAGTGACVDFAGMGAVALGGACDDLTDCVPEADLCFIGETSVFNHMCSIICTSDAECDAAIPGSVCFDLGNGFGGCGMP